MTLTQPGIGLEIVAKAAIIQLAKFLDANIDAQAALWSTSDATFAASLDRVVEPVILEHIPKDHIHYGFRPSILRAPVPLELFPAIVVYPARSLAVAPFITFDQDDVQEVDNIIIVELRHRSLVSEEHVGPITTRTTDAIHTTLMQDPKWGGLIDNVTFRTLDITVVERNIGHGDAWFWQGSRLEYAVRKASIYQ